MDASGQELLVDGSRDGVVRISFNRPHKKNALTPGMYDGLLRALESASQRSDLHALVLTGVGDAFCAGGDVKRMANAPDRLTDAQRRERLLGRTRIVRLLHAFPVPTLAVIRGPVVGAGLSIAMACDIRISGQSGRFRTGFMRVGLSGDFGGHYFFRQAAGGAGASELYLLDEDIDVARAYALGLIHKVVEDGRLEQLEADIVAKWMNAPVDSLRHLKRNLIESRGCSLDDVLQMEAGRHVACVMSPGHKDAIARLNSKTRRDFGQERGVESKLCEGRVVIVTGAGQGLGREYALQLARHGAKVVVNDIGTSRDGYGRDESAAMEVVEAIRLEGGRLWRTTMMSATGKERGSSLRTRWTCLVGSMG